MMMIPWVAGAIVTAAGAVRSSSAAQAYEQFRLEFRSDRQYTDTANYADRIALFEQRREQVRIHNLQSGTSWKAGLNKFADYTDEEFNMLLGHRPSWHTRASRASSGPSSFLQVKPSLSVVQDMDWTANSTAAMIAKNQGGCGSCWAVAAAGAIESALEINSHKVLPVSYEQLVDCTPNPQHCGGAGGCKGATAELAFEYASKNPIALQDDYKGYQTGGDGKCHTPTISAVSVGSFERLPVNEYAPLLEAVATKGTVVVSADAGQWSLYSHGVFDSCGKDAVINHAILLTGFGFDKNLQKKYWRIRNSWGPDWGEDGFIRLLRHERSDAYCGVDRKPSDGVGCDNGPATLPVCGMCGVLADSAFPIDVKAV